MPKLTVDGIEVEVPAGTTVLQACEAAGKEIPRFCYHERLSIAGNCRMCLVELEKAPKPIASCAYPVADNMVIHTDTPGVKAARRGVMEFLLINHPLDCPICDQGGECDLQDQAVGYGFDHSRYEENKRAVKDKNLGPLIKTAMTRCIHCTRCVRFATEVAGVAELGATGRGEAMEIGTYVEHALTSELSGNMIDLCPVGALTSKPYAFVARPWELSRTDGIDATDAVGSNIRIDSRGPQVLRILPRLNEAVNEEWISDKTRFSNDGLTRRRLDKPWIREGGKLRPASWNEAFAAIAARTKGLAGDRIAALAGDMVDVEAMAALRDLMAALGSGNIDCRQDGARIDASRRDFYLFNTTIAGIEQADAALLIGTNPRREAAVLNARLRKRSLAGRFPIGLVGEGADLTYPYAHLGDGPAALAALLDGSSPFLEALKGASHPMVIIGQGAIARPDGAAVLAAAWTIAREIGALGAAWHGFNMLHMAAGRVGALDIGFLPHGGGRDRDGILAGAGNGEIDLVWLLGADEIPMDRLGRAFVVYQGHHGDAGAKRADVILPGAAYVEKDGTWVSTEGRVQRAARAVFPPGEAREDWAIIRAASAALGHALPYGDIAGVRARAEALGAGRLDAPLGGGCIDQGGPSGDPRMLGTEAFAAPVTDYYRTDAIGRASPTMAACAASVAPTSAVAAE
ncbi:NADH-quinone oxidoreductase subunit NuoG [Elioraea sp.]|uniref:NADH-quinone oxidoreductase subunit NuoG n=1 Tax=Elioraea sp. TaxID=2185103 RepID=UPI0025BD9E09|nr:NADH-quinone oxidoreductase subunit NuoG [Elioraea sp.]